MIDAPVYLDAVLTLFLAGAAGVHYVHLGVFGHQLGRWLQAIGFTGLALRFGWQILIGQDPQIAAVSLPLMFAVAGGTMITALRQLREGTLDVRCMANPAFRCRREDRIKTALLGRREG